jgi:hypothetical protein
MSSAQWVDYDDGHAGGYPHMCDVANSDEQNKHAEMVARLRRIADELTWANLLYDYDPASGQWSPRSLRYEAEYLERHP